MMEVVQEVIGWCFPLAYVAVIIIAATRRGFPGKPWLIAHSSIELACTLAWRIPSLTLRFDVLEFDISRFYDIFALPLNIIGLAGYCMLIPFVLVVSKPSLLCSSDHADTAALQDESSPVDTGNPLYGVHGWLKFFVVVNMYIAPVLFGIRQIIAFFGFSMLAEDYPGIVVVGLIEAGANLFFVIKWIMIARRLRDVVPGVVQEAKKWLIITLAWNVVSIPLVFLSGMDAEYLMPEAIKGLFYGIIGFAIWYSYFNVSKRVKATYPDWNK